MERTWDMWLAILVFTLVLVGFGGWLGTLYQAKHDQEQYRRYIQKATTDTYVQAFADGIHMSKNYQAIGIANYCNLNLDQHTLQCNYNTDAECEGYKSFGEFCVEHRKEDTNGH